MVYCIAYYIAYGIAEKELYGLRNGRKGAVWLTIWIKGSCMIKDYNKRMRYKS